MSHFSAKQVGESLSNRKVGAYGVRYEWTDADGVKCQARSVSTGRDRAHAERRFFRSHRNVFPVTGETINPDTN